MHSLSPSPRIREQWIYCLAAVAEVVHRLPVLYKVIEKGPDDVRLEVHLQAGAFEVLRFRDAGGDQIVTSIGADLDRSPALSFPRWLLKATDRLASDLQWAASRGCTDQGDEVLSALIRFRGTMLAENGRGHARSVIERARMRLGG